MGVKIIATCIVLGYHHILHETIKENFQLIWTLHKKYNEVAYIMFASMSVCFTSETI
jgi:hypothetical protein